MTCSPNSYVNTFKMISFGFQKYFLTHRATKCSCYFDTHGDPCAP